MYLLGYDIGSSSVKASLVVVMVLVLLSGCIRSEHAGEDVTIPGTIAVSLTLDEAQDIFAACKPVNAVDGARFGRYILSYDVNDIGWDRARLYHNHYTGLDIAEVPFSSERGIRFFRWTSPRRASLLDSSQRILVVKDEDGRTGAFFMTVIADRDYTRSHRKTDLSEKVRNDGNWDDFSGVVIYSLLSGTIVRANRYRDGSLVSEASVYSLPESCVPQVWGRMLIAVTGELSAVSEKVAVRTRGGGDDSLGGWWEGDTTDFLLDSSVCYGDTTGPFDPYDPFDPFWDFGDGGEPGGGGGPDPGGGGGGGTGSGVITGGSDGQYGYASLTVGGKTLKLWYGADFASQDKAHFQDVLSAMQNNIAQFADILTKLVGIDDYSEKLRINVLPSGFFANTISDSTRVYYYSINGQFSRYNNVQMYLNLEGLSFGFLEEFFHALQYLYTERTELAKKGDIEFEAKAFMGKMFDLYFQSDTSKILRDNRDYFRAISNYVDNRTEENRDSALSALVHMGYLHYEMSYEGVDLDTYLDSILTTYHLYF